MVRLERSTSESCWEDDSEMELKKNMGTRGQASLRYQIDSYNKCCLEEEECLLAESVSWRHPYLYFLTPHCFWFQIICMIGLPLTKYEMLGQPLNLSVLEVSLICKRAESQTWVLRNLPALNFTVVQLVPPSARLHKSANEGSPWSLYTLEPNVVSLWVRKASTQSGTLRLAGGFSSRAALLAAALQRGKKPGF